METAIVVPVERAELLLAAAQSALGFDRPPGLPAHVTLLYPFVDSEHLVVGHAHQAQRALSTFEPFECAFSSIRRFDNPPVATVLEPEQDERLEAMIEALATAFPEFPPYGGAFEEVVPHLTLVESNDRFIWELVEARVEPALPLKIHVRTFSIYHQTTTGWQEKFRLPLGESPSEGDLDDSLTLL